MEKLIIIFLSIFFNLQVFAQDKGNGGSGGGGPSIHDGFVWNPDFAGDLTGGRPDRVVTQPWINTGDMLDMLDRNGVVVDRIEIQDGNTWYAKEKDGNVFLHPDAPVVNYQNSFGETIKFKPFN